MIQKVIFPKLPSINELINAERTNRYKAAKLKTDVENALMLNVRQQNIHPIIGEKVVLWYDFYESMKNRDYDNISGFAHKVVQDSLVKSHILENDGAKNITGFIDSFHYDKGNPRIEVTIITMTTEAYSDLQEKFRKKVMRP